MKPQDNIVIYTFGELYEFYLDIINTNGCIPNQKTLSKLYIKWNNGNIEKLSQIKND